jgi:hypothetical protein
VLAVKQAKQKKIELRSSKLPISFKWDQNVRIIATSTFFSRTFQYLHLGAILSPNSGTVLVNPHRRHNSLELYRIAGIAPFATGCWNWWIASL